MTADRRTVALGLAAVAAVTAAVVVTLTNHKSGTSGPRKRVGDYIQQVNAVQSSMQAPLSRVLLAYKDFAKQRIVRHDPRPELAAATVTLGRLSRRLAAIPAPPEARKLRRLILQLVAQETEITREVKGIATFTAPFTRLLGQAHEANLRLSAALRAVVIPQPHRLRGTKAQVLAAERAYQAQAAAAAGAQADAIDAYDAALGGLVGRFRKLRPPLVFAPEYTAQVHALESLRTAGGRLSAELRKPKRPDVATLGRKFTIASRIAQSTAAQEAQIAAIRAYNTRARAVGTAVGRVQTELLHLQQQLP